MKMVDVRLKCVTPNLEILNKLLKLAGVRAWQESMPQNIFFWLTPEVDSRVNWGADAERFCDIEVPLIPYDDAIKLLESCDENQSKSNGEWFEYFITDGCFTIPNGEYAFRHAWQNYQAAEAALDIIFAGWQYEGSDSWRGRMGTTEAGLLTSDTDLWEKPLIPTKIRFWKENK